MKKDLPVWLWCLYSVLLVLLIGLIDHLTGQHFNFFVFFFLPVALAAWYSGRVAAVSFAVFSAIVWFAVDFTSGHVLPNHFYAVWNTMVRLISFLTVGLLVARLRSLVERERQSAAELKQLLLKVKVMESFLPICCQCKKIRKDDGQWQQLEAYLSEHTDTVFSHGYCPDCFKKALSNAQLLE